LRCCGIEGDAKHGKFKERVKLKEELNKERRRR